MFYPILFPGTMSCGRRRCVTVGCWRKWCWREDCNEQVLFTTVQLSDVMPTRNTGCKSHNIVSRSINEAPNVGKLLDEIIYEAHYINLLKANLRVVVFSTIR
jgi:hypothetical protein